ncbi:MAG: DNA integrity scanning protein DisA nucleotide-binding domain protein [Candidatus Woesearchaeota archaeon]|jgi:diadenylate cyclase|nr:DNA integrity scanning protein DisA nucleotide-binding domain protein [Candidatus Woesearchaeota archaeon]
MTTNSSSNGDFLDIKISEMCDKLKITHVLKIEEAPTNNFGVVDELEILIFNRENKIQKKFKIKNEPNQDSRIFIRNILVEAIKKKILEKESIVLIAFEDSIISDYTFGMIVIEVSKILYRIARFKLSEFMENELVLEKIIEIAEEIKKEGREGKHIGTLFVIGDEKELKQYIKPLVLNPFYGYPENLRDIINNDLNETIKEYAQLDGAFVINNKGIVYSAGSYIDINTDDVKRYYGWGTKHTTAAAITQKTKSIAVVVSESGGVIKLFKNGKLILKF